MQLEAVPVPAGYEPASRSDGVADGEEACFILQFLREQIDFRNDVVAETVLCLPVLLYLGSGGRAA